jgi:hypothetical protein
MDEYNEKFGKSFKQLTKTHKGILDYILGTEGCEKMKPKILTDRLISPHQELEKQSSHR